MIDLLREQAGGETPPEETNVIQLVKDARKKCDCPLDSTISINQLIYPNCGVWSHKACDRALDLNRPDCQRLMRAAAIDNLVNAALTMLDVTTLTKDEQQIAGEVYGLANHLEHLIDERT